MFICDMGKKGCATKQQTRGVPAEMLDQELEGVNIASRERLETTLEFSQSDITVRNSYTIKKAGFSNVS